MKRVIGTLLCIILGFIAYGCYTMSNTYDVTCLKAFAINEAELLFGHKLLPSGITSENNIIRFISEYDMYKEEMSDELKQNIDVDDLALLMDKYMINTNAITINYIRSSVYEDLLKVTNDNNAYENLFIEADNSLDVALNEYSVVSPYNFWIFISIGCCSLIVIALYALIYKD